MFEFGVGRGWPGRELGFWRGELDGGFGGGLGRGFGVCRGFEGGLGGWRGWIGHLEI